MRCTSPRRLLCLAAVLASAAIALPVRAQTPPPPAALAMAREELSALAKVFIAISAARDSMDIQFAASRNKTPQAQQLLQEKLQAQIAEILHHSGMTQEEYRKKTFVISTDGDTRKAFDSTVAKITGVPTPGQVQPTAANPVVAVPAGPVGTHLGHVANAFGDTPDGMGLLPAALAEARIAAQHATLAARDPNNLASMKTHAGHVLHALDPAVVMVGPGRGYGVKKAATGVASHVELAAKAAGASPNVINHSNHIATAARNTVERADQIIALAQQVQNATSAADAANLISQIVSLTDQLVKGADTNGDGRITWEKGEGGLQQAQEHLTLMLGAER